MNGEINIYSVASVDGLDISLVKEPANGSHFIRDGSEVYGVVLLPDELIYRKEEKEDYFIYFEEDIIKELSSNLLKTTFSVNHKDKIEAKVLESYIIKNTKDEYLKFKNLKAGTWILRIDVGDLDITKYNGFSIDTEVNLKLE